MVSIGIDVSKEKSMICILRPYGEVVKSPFEIRHTKEELAGLIEIIHTFQEETKVILEATGCYHLPIVNTLLENKICVCVINPFLMKKYAGITIRKGKTDKIDAVKIAGYGLSNWLELKPFTLTDEIYRELNLLSRQYQQYISMKVKAKIALGNLLDKTMPGITSLLRNSDLTPEKDKLNTFVREFWHFDTITHKTEKAFVSCYLRWTKKEGFQPSESKAKALYALALNGIPTLNSNTPSTKMLVLEAVRVLREIEKTVTAILTQMQVLAKTLNEYPVVRAMNGVGDKLAPQLIAEIGDVRRFHNASALVAFAGIDSPPFQSGSFSSTKRSISKRGNKYLRKVGYEVMQSLKCVKPLKDTAVYDFILKKEAEGKSMKCAKIAGLNKFLRIYYARVQEVYSFIEQNTSP